MTDKLTVADLNAAALAKLQALEAELGTTVVAYQQKPNVAPLTEDQVHRLQQLEVELGLTLLAFKK